MTALNKHALREELEICSKDRMRKIALAMLDELETKEEQRANWFQMAQKLGGDLDAAEKRIAELEARKVTVKLPADYRNDDGSINDDMFNTCAVVGAFRDALAAAGIGVKGE